MGGMGLVYLGCKSENEADDKNRDALDKCDFIFMPWITDKCTLKQWRKTSKSKHQCRERKSQIQKMTS